MLNRHAAESGGDYMTALGKVSPPLAVSAGAIAGFSLQDWVLIATLVYTVLQTAFLVYKFVRDRLAERGGYDG